MWEYYSIILIVICITLAVYILYLARKKSLQFNEHQQQLAFEREKVKKELEQLKEQEKKRLFKELDDRVRLGYLRFNITAMLIQLLHKKIDAEDSALREKEEALLEKEKQIRTNVLLELDVELRMIKEKEQKRLFKELHGQVDQGYLRYSLASQLIQILYRKIESEATLLRVKEESIMQMEKILKGYDSQIISKKNQIEELQKNLRVFRNELVDIRKDIDSYEVSFYEVRYNLENSRLYRERLDDIRQKQKYLLHLKTACICETTWLVGNSKTKGKGMINRNIKLMLKAFNGECHSIIANVNYKNITSMERRIDRVFKAVNELGKTLDCKIAHEYYELKKEELFLVYEYQEKLYQEKEEQRIIKTQMEEEIRAQREFEKALLEAEKESERYGKALEQARKEVENKSGKQLKELMMKIYELEHKLNEAEANKRAISQAQITKSGYVYVISNIGSFGESVYKIGMTRRLDPYERIIELNGPSVPFKFDIHAMIFSKNAPELEFAMHKKLTERRLNRVNNRKEFFEVTLEEVEKVSIECGVMDVEFIHVHEAKEYRLSIAEKEKRQESAVL